MIDYGPMEENGLSKELKTRRKPAGIKPSSCTSPPLGASFPGAQNSSSLAKRDHKIMVSACVKYWSNWCEGTIDDIIWHIILFNDIYHWFWKDLETSWRFELLVQTTTVHIRQHPPGNSSANIPKISMHGVLAAVWSFEREDVPFWMGKVMFQIIGMNSWHVWWCFGLPSSTPSADPWTFPQDITESCFLQCCFSIEKDWRKLLQNSRSLQT